ncbi:TIGR02444 family protein [Legionella taurinensis]|uniref:TIGR02444 family protein n=1 Tax=Legionella taurinensis TaxID=70611 RepID=A0A3A5L8N3_9GAMM|nr:TIGR02444 family protein [Legionella taurinensis]MDX1837372.1 TIGR02444 family protein [Legionella taurinensis]PUT40726.1 TIGR02444 family protein [Legionella taurinensis]PUT44148.1 TIGR02444 family protein [Legionella taurinensis]PUT47449.1 TIGR02444 family protein [Legionella taurinensis]PUT48588.1 TIGR02444 family protein [Legionella taurinensis]
MTTPLDNPFWQFSNHLYRNPQVKTICLTLQNQWQYNVNLVLFCAWSGQTQRLIRLNDMQNAVALVAETQSRLTEPLRCVRHYLASLPADVGIKADYGQILQLELVSESLQQDALYRAFKDKPQADSIDVKQQKLLYLHWLTEVMNQSLTEALQRLFLDLISF